METLSVVLLAPPSPLRDRARDVVSGAAPALSLEVMDSVEAFLSRENGQEEEEPEARSGVQAEEGGVLLMGPGLSAEDMLRLLRSQRDRPGSWVTLLLEGEESTGMKPDEADDLRAWPLTLGHPLPPSQVATKAADPQKEGPILDLHWILRVVARARHDLNNPLTSGLAEVQLLLMDEHPPEVRESLETIQEQFRRLRDMVAELTVLRVPRARKDREED
jgi:signal transduction histidine kinase